MSATIAQVLKAIADTLSTATGLTYVQNYDALTDGMQNYPTLQVWPHEIWQDPETRNDRSTFQAGVRQTNAVIWADLYARQRAHIGQDMAALVDLISAITVVFERQDTKPYFGLDGIKAFSWHATEFCSPYGDPNVNYIGMRWEITVRLF